MEQVPDTLEGGGYGCWAAWQQGGGGFAVVMVTVASPSAWCLAVSVGHQSGPLGGLLLASPVPVQAKAGCTSHGDLVTSVSYSLVCVRLSVPATPR
eukprot:scaffold2727_cov385-Prasinococcus_capsulatus_cf.AAC.7